MLFRSPDTPFSYIESLERRVELLRALGVAFVSVLTFTSELQQVAAADFTRLLVEAAGLRVLVVGDVMLDRYWYGAVDRISPEAPVPVVRVNREENRLGGCANVAYNVVQLGAQCGLLSVVGDDEASHQLEELVAQTGIAPHFGRDALLKTTVKLRVIGRQQQLLRIDFENTPQTEVLASMSDRFTQLLGQTDAVLFSDYGKGGLTHVAQMIRSEEHTSELQSH